MAEGFRKQLAGLETELKTIQVAKEGGEKLLSMVSSFRERVFDVLEDFLPFDALQKHIAGEKVKGLSLKLKQLKTYSIMGDFDKSFFTVVGETDVSYEEYKTTLFTVMANNLLSYVSQKIFPNQRISTFKELYNTLHANSLSPGEYSGDSMGTYKKMPLKNYIKYIGFDDLKNIVGEFKGKNGLGIDRFHTKTDAICCINDEEVTFIRFATLFCKSKQIGERGEFWLADVCALFTAIQNKEITNQKQLSAKIQEIQKKIRLRKHVQSIVGNFSAVRTVLQNFVSTYGLQKKEAWVVQKKPKVTEPRYFNTNSYRREEEKQVGLGKESFYWGIFVQNFGAMQFRYTNVIDVPRSLVLELFNDILEGKITTQEQYDAFIAASPKKKQEKEELKKEREDLMQYNEQFIQYIKSILKNRKNDPVSLHKFLTEIQKNPSIQQAITKPGIQNDDVITFSEFKEPFLFSTFLFNLGVGFGFFSKKKYGNTTDVRNFLVKIGNNEITKNNFMEKIAEFRKKGTMYQQERNQTFGIESEKNTALDAYFTDLKIMQPFQEILQKLLSFRKYTDFSKEMDYLGNKPVYIAGGEYTFYQIISAFARRFGLYRDDNLEKRKVPYDTFIKNTLFLGVVRGDFLHSTQIESVAKSFLRKQKKKEEEKQQGTVNLRLYSEKLSFVSLKELLQHFLSESSISLHAGIPVDFSALVVAKKNIRLDGRLFRFGSFIDVFGVVTGLCVQGTGRLTAKIADVYSLFNEIVCGEITSEEGFQNSLTIKQEHIHIETNRELSNADLKNFFSCLSLAGFQEILIQNNISILDLKTINTKKRISLPGFLDKNTISRDRFITNLLVGKGVYEDVRWAVKSDAVFLLQQVFDGTIKTEEAFDRLIADLKIQRLLREKYTLDAESSCEILEGGEKKKWKSIVQRQQIEGLGGASVQDVIKRLDNENYSWRYVRKQKYMKKNVGDKKSTLVHLYREDKLVSLLRNYNEAKRNIKKLSDFMIQDDNLQDKKISPKLKKIDFTDPSIKTFLTTYYLNGTQADYQKFKSEHLEIVLPETLSAFWELLGYNPYVDISLKEWLKKMLPTSERDDGQIAAKYKEETRTWDEGSKTDGMVLIKKELQNLLEDRKVFCYKNYYNKTMYAENVGLLNPKVAFPQTMPALIKDLGGIPTIFTREYLVCLLLGNPNGTLVEQKLREKRVALEQENPLFSYKKGTETHKVLSKKVQEYTGL